MTIEEKATVRELAESIKQQFGGKDVLNADEFAAYLGKSRQFVCNSIHARLLPGQKIGGTFMIPVNSIALWEHRVSKTREAQEY